MTVTTRIMICVGVITASPMKNGSVGSMEGKDLTLGFQIIMASACSKMDMPSAVIRGARRGALRSGR